MIQSGDPKVSVLMTAFNRADFIAESIQSVLNSSFQNFELIVVDDGSTDNTVEIARSFAHLDSRVKVYVNEKNLGDYNNRNYAATLGTGKYIKYLDSDDLIYPHGLEVMVRGMENFPDAGIGIMSQDNQDVQPYPFCLSPQEAYQKHFFQKGFFLVGPTALIMHRERFLSVGSFSGKRFVGDTELVLRMARNWPVVKLSSSLVFWRIHEGQEFQLGHSSLNAYLEAELPLYEAEINHPECPLSTSEKQRILSYLRAMYSRKVLSIALKAKKPGAAIKLSKKLSLTSRDIYNGIFFKLGKI